MAALSQSIKIGHNVGTLLFANSNGDGPANVNVVKGAKTYMVLAWWVCNDQCYMEQG